MTKQFDFKKPRIEYDEAYLDAVRAVKNEGELLFSESSYDISLYNMEISTKEYGRVNVNKWELDESSKDLIKSIHFIKEGSYLYHSEFQNTKKYDGVKKEIEQREKLFASIIGATEDYDYFYYADVFCPFTGKLVQEIGDNMYHDWYNQRFKRKTHTVVWKYKDAEYKKDIVVLDASKIKTPVISKKNFDDLYDQNVIDQMVEAWSSDKGSIGDPQDMEILRDYGTSVDVWYAHTKQIVNKQLYVTPEKGRYFNFKSRHFVDSPDFKVNL